MITTAIITALGPCQDRLDNFTKCYPNFSGTAEEFLSLDLPLSDKTWVAFGLIGRSRLPLVAADIAESVLHLYEEQYPGDSRPRDAIAAARRGDTEAARAAACAADVAARAAVYAAWAARAAVQAAAYAAWAAADAAAACATWSAAMAAESAAKVAVMATKAAGNEKGVLKIICNYLEGA